MILTGSILYLHKNLGIYVAIGSLFIYYLFKIFLDMDVFEAIKGRRSVRSFKSEQISDEVIERILEAAQWAPSAGDLQARDFIVVKDGVIKEALCHAAWDQEFIVEAPVDIVVCANEKRASLRYGARGRELYCILDAAAAVQNLMLGAYALGLGTCWVGAFDDDEVKRVLNLPEWERPIAIIPIGYPDERPKPTPRLPLDRVMHKEKYGSR
jgi:nitroreductase